VPSGRPGLVEFPAGQVTFHSHLPEGQEPREVICPLKWSLKLRLVWGSKICLRAFLSPAIHTRYVEGIMGVYWILIYIPFLFCFQVDTPTTTPKDTHSQGRKIHVGRIWFKITDSDTNWHPRGKSELNESISFYLIILLCFIFAKLYYLQVRCMLVHSIFLSTQS